MDFDVAENISMARNVFCVSSSQYTHHLFFFFFGCLQYLQCTGIFSRPNEERNKCWENSSNSFYIFFLHWNRNYLLQYQSRIRIALSARNLMHKFEQTAESVSFHFFFFIHLVAILFVFLWLLFCYVFVVDVFLATRRIIILPMNSNSSAVGCLCICVFEPVQWRNETRRNLIDECRILCCRTECNTLFILRYVPHSPVVVVKWKMCYIWQKYIHISNICICFFKNAIDRISFWAFHWTVGIWFFFFHLHTLLRTRNWNGIY